MRRTLLTTLMIATAYGLVASAAPPNASPAPKAIVAKALDSAPQSRMDGTQAVDDAVAAALIGAISTQFGTRTVQVKLDQVDSMPSSIVQRDLAGRGRLMIGGDEAWIPFEFTALYDTTDASVGYPSLTLGGGAAGRPLPADARLGRQLADQVDRRIGAEFAQQDAHVALDDVRLSQPSGHLIQVHATGIADFGVEGATPAGVEALYDPQTGEWLHVRYELGATANRGDDASLGDAVAAR